MLDEEQQRQVREGLKLLITDLLSKTKEERDNLLHLEGSNWARAESRVKALESDVNRLGHLAITEGYLKAEEVYKLMKE